MIEQRCLRAHHVGDGDHREAQVPRLAGRRIARQRTGGAHAAAQHVGADQEVARGIEHLARPDHALPPALLAGHRMLLDDELIAGQRVADQDGVGLVGVQRAVGLVGHAIGAEIDAAVELERPLGAQDRVATSGQRLAFGFGEIVQHANPLQRKSPRPEGRGLFWSTPTF